MDDNENIEADSDGGSFAEEDWNDPEQDEVPKWTEPDVPMKRRAQEDRHEVLPVWRRVLDRQDMA